MAEQKKAGKIRQAVEISIADGETRGRICAKRDAAALEVLRYMADELDRADGAQIMRIIPPATFLNYCEKLGLLPDIGKGKPTTEEPPGDSNGIMNRSKWAQRYSRGK